MAAEIAALGRRGWRGALRFSMVGLAYGVTECLFTSVLPSIIPPSAYHEPQNRLALTGLLLLYPAIAGILGFFVGVILGPICPRSPERGSADESRRLHCLAGLALVIAFATHLLLRSRWRPMWTVLLLVVLLAAVGLLVRLLSREQRPRLVWATNPWTVSFLLLGLPWVTVDLIGPDGARFTKALAGVLFLAAVGAVSALAGAAVHRESDCRSRWRSIALAGVVVAVFLSGLWCNVPGGLSEEPSAASDTRVGAPNLVLIVLDTVRADHLSVYGYHRRTTPNLEEFARDASVFTAAISTADTTLPAHASIFTGLYARSHGAHFSDAHPGGRPLPPDVRTLAETLRRDGYRTAGVAANYGFLAPEFGLHRGFEHYDCRMRSPLLQATRIPSLRNELNAILLPLLGLPARDRRLRRAGEINEEALAVLDSRGVPDRPFFLFLNYMDTHRPYFPPSPFDRLFPGADRPMSAPSLQRLHDEVNGLRRALDGQERERLVSLYDACITYLDSEVGALLRELRRRGIYDQSLIIITGDHGEALGERNLYEHGVSVYQDQVHVPLLVKWPGRGEGKTESRPVSLVDILPTVLDVLGVDPGSRVQGRSLRRPVEPGASTFVVAESYPSGYMRELDPRFARVERAVVSGPYKLVASTAGKMEFFDLRRGETEAARLSLDDPHLAHLARQLASWVAEVRPREGTAGDLDRQVLDRLRSLGYLK